MDIPSTSTSSLFTSVHLLVLMHGMWGNPSHLAEAFKVIREKADSSPKREGTESVDEQIEFEVLVAQANQQGSTYDGIDWGGERIADEICEHVEKLESDDKKKVTKFSVLGYSLGGLLGRYVIGILESRKFFNKVQPVNFNTIATPHVGLPRYPGSVFSSLANTLGPRLLSRTGEQFFTVDQWNNTGKPLLEVMADMETIFMEALVKFENIAIYANAVNDLTVPYVTASINEDDPYVSHEERGLEVKFTEGYKPIINSYSLPDTPPPKPKGPPLFSGAWFKAVKEYKPPLPPFLQRPFPWNLMLYAATPVLLPTFICLVLLRLSIDSRASRARVKLLEEEALSSEGGQGKLITLLRNLEKEMDDAVAELIDSSGPEFVTEERLMQNSKANTTSSCAETIVAEPVKESVSNSKMSQCTSKLKAQPKSRKNMPFLKPSQKRMVKSLNANLRQMKKYDVYIHPIRNSHATIIVRDAKGFDFHRLGEGVLRHWADGFVF